MICAEKAKIKADKISYKLAKSDIKYHIKLAVNAGLSSTEMFVDCKVSVGFIKAANEFEKLGYTFDRINNSQILIKW